MVTLQFRMQCCIFGRNFSAHDAIIEKENKYTEKPTSLNFAKIIIKKSPKHNNNNNNVWIKLKM